MILRIVREGEKPERKSRSRMLRSAVHEAQNDYDCSNCKQTIFRGEIYRREVWLDRFGRLYEVFYHEPECEPWDPWEDEDSEDDRFRDSEISDDIDKAA